MGLPSSTRRRSIDVELLGDGVGHQRSSDGTEEHALLAHLGDNAHRSVVQLLGQSVGIGNASLLALGDVLLALLKLLQVARSSLHGVALGQQEVVGKAAVDVDDVALAAFALEFLQKNNFHGSPPFA